MRGYDELERLWRASPPPPRDRGTVRLICLRLGGGVHACPVRVRLTPEGGVEGDRWKGSRECQVTLMNVRAAELVAADHAPLHAAGDNFLVDLDLSEEALPAGTRLRLGSALLEVSKKPHTGCSKFNARFGPDALRWVNADDRRRLRGVNCRVAGAGDVALGDAVEIVR
jgi:MOSC domain-containing protein YiiM